MHRLIYISFECFESYKMDQKYQTYTYNELVTEFKTIINKTENLKRDLILEMAKRKELEGLEHNKIKATIEEDLKDVVSKSYIRNVLAEISLTEKKHDPTAFKKEIKAKEEEKQKMLVVAGGGMEMPEPEEPLRQIEPRPDDDENDLTSMIQRNNEEEIIDQRPTEQKDQDYSEAEEELDKITMIRDLKRENNNLTQEIRDFDKKISELEQLRTENEQLFQEGIKLKKRITELEEENRKLKQEVKALRNTPSSSTPAAAPSSRFSSTKHDDYNKSKYYKMVGKGK